MEPITQKNGAVLHVEGLKKYFPIRKGFLQRVVDWVKAVDGVDVWVGPRQTLGLVGESGCGKTTVARLILRLLEKDAGSIRYKGNEIGGFTDRQMKPLRKEIQVVFQDPYGSLNPRMTIAQSIGEGLRILGIGKSQWPDRLETLLRGVGMSPDIADRYPHEFSGGQRQRIGIARALSVEPSLVICDEPISALDVSIQAQIINLLKDLQDRLGLSYLFISHDLNVVGYLCNTVSVMYRGRIVEHGPAEALFDAPAHPYTRNLLAAIPEPEPGKKKDWPSIPEEADTGLSPPAGCGYQRQCPHAEDRCESEPDRFVRVGKDHQVRCWKTAGKDSR